MLALDLADSTVDWSDAFWDSGRSWQVCDVTGTTSPVSDLSISTADWADAQGDPFHTVRPGAFFSLSLSANDVDLNYTDATPPTVTGTSPSFAVSGTLDAGATALQISFSEPVIGADYGPNFELRDLGPDGPFGTDDDTLVPLTVSYAGDPTTLDFAPLHTSATVYRLTLSDTIADGVYNALDGDGDGTAGADWLREFEVKYCWDGGPGGGRAPTGTTR